MSFGVVLKWPLGLRVVAALVTVATTTMVPMRLPAQAATGTISGRVLTADGRPLPGATVTAQREGEDTGLNAAADAQGVFSLAGLPAAGYEVWFEASCYLAERRDIALAAGAHAQGMEVRLAPGAVVFGTVRDSSGAAVTGAWVSIEGACGPGGSAKTDTQGRYQLGGIAPGERLLRMSLGDLMTHLDRFAIQSGTQRLDLTFPPRREIHGRVLSPEGTPVAHARVVARLRDPYVLETWSRSDGTFTFTVFDGWYRLSVEEEGALGELREPVRIHGASRSGVEIRQCRTAIGGTLSGLSAAELAAVSVHAGREGTDIYRESAADKAGRYRIDHLAPGAWHFWAAVGGKRMDRTVILAAEEHETTIDFAFPAYFAVSGQLLQADARPLQVDMITEVTFDDPAHPEDLPYFAHTYLDPQGRFTALLPSGSYRIAVEVSMATYRFATQPLVVSGAPREGIAIRLDASGTIAGRVLGLPAGETADLQARQGGLLQWGHSDTDGRYRISGLSPGAWELVTWAPGVKTMRIPVTLAADRPEAAVDVRFPSGALTLSGRLVGFDPAARYVVKIEGLCNRSADVQPDGSFRLSGLPAGHYQVEVHDDAMAPGPNWPLHQAELDLAADREVLLQLSLPQ